MGGEVNGSGLLTELLVVGFAAFLAVLVGLAGLLLWDRFRPVLDDKPPEEWPFLVASMEDDPELVKRFQGRKEGP